MRQVKLSSPELVNLIRIKSRKGAEVLYDQYSAVLLLAIFRIVPQKKQADDILEKTFVRIWLTIDQYNEQEKPLLAWMMAIARQLAREIQEAEVVNVNIKIIRLQTVMPPKNGIKLAIKNLGRPSS